MVDLTKERERANIEKSRGREWGREESEIVLTFCFCFRLALPNKKNSGRAMVRWNRGCDAARILIRRGDDDANKRIIIKLSLMVVLRAFDLIRRF